MDRSNNKCEGQQRTTNEHRTHAQTGMNGWMQVSVGEYSTKEFGEYYAQMWVVTNTHK